MAEILERFFNVYTDKELKYIIGFVITTDFASSIGPRTVFLFLPWSIISSIIDDDVITSYSTMAIISRERITLSLPIWINIVFPPYHSTVPWTTRKSSAFFNV